MIENQQLPFTTGGSLILDCEDGPITSVTSVAVYEASADDTSSAESATTGSAAVALVMVTTFPAGAPHTALAGETVALPS